MAAYHLYLRGRHLRYTKLDLNGALDCFRESAERDPQFAEPRAASGEIFALLTLYEVVDPATGAALAREELGAATELGGETAQTVAVEGLLKLACDWDARAGTELLERAIELDPTYMSARAWSASRPPISSAQARASR